MIYTTFLDYIESSEDCEITNKSLFETFEKEDILQNKKEIQLIFQLIIKLADNHHRPSGFFNKIEKVIQYLIQKNSSIISDFIDYGKYNKRILLLLLEKRFLKPDQSFIDDYLRNKPSNSTFSMKNFNEFQFFYFLYPGMKQYISEETQQQIEDEIKHNFQEDISSFSEKCHIGENDSYVCSLIRSDSVEDFVSYVNRTNLSLSSKIRPSIYETNFFLIGKEMQLIEYAAFFGSIQIIQYLKYSKVSLDFSLWLYGIHSNCAELVHFLEENVKKTEKKWFLSHDSENINETFYKVLTESIKCHHNDISNYIKDNLLEESYKGSFSNLESYILDSLNFAFYPKKVGYLISKPFNEGGFTMYKLCSTLKAITIPSSVTSIGASAFKKCSFLEQIIIPSSVKLIWGSAFSECSSLTQIFIHSSVTSVGDNAFYKCISLSQVTFEKPCSITSIKNMCFNGCISLKHLEIPSSITSVKDYAFFGCSSLDEVSFESPSSLTSIDNLAFNGCSSLRQVTIPSSVKSIGNNVFNGCSLLTQITIAHTVESIGNNAFSGCSSLEQIIFEAPSSLTSIGYNAFNACSSLAQITIPSSLKSIENGIFNRCSSLEQITFESPSSVTSFGYNAFCECTSLSQIKIPSSVMSIGSNSFNKCSSLKQIMLDVPSSLTSIGYNAFNECSSLTKVSIPSTLKIDGIGLNPKHITVI